MSADDPVEPDEQDQGDEITEGNSFEINKALAAVCAEEDTRYALSFAAVLPNPDPEKVYLVGCDGRMLGIVASDGHCKAPFLIKRHMLAGKVGRLYLDPSGQVTFPFVADDSNPPYPDIMGVLPKKPESEAIGISVNPEFLSKLLKLFAGLPSVTLFVHDDHSKLVLAGDGAIGVLMPLTSSSAEAAGYYRSVRELVGKHLPTLAKGEKPERVKLESGETVDTETGEVVEPEPLPEGTCSKCGSVGITTSLAIPGRKPTPPLCTDCFNAVMKHSGQDGVA